MRRRRIRRLIKRESGATLAEVTVVLPLFLFLLVTGLTLSIELYRVASLNFVLSRTARVEHGIPPFAAGQHELIENLAIDFAEQFGLVLNEQDIWVCLASDTACRDTGANETATGSDTLISIALHRQAALPFGLAFNYRTVPFSRNEPL